MSEVLKKVIEKPIGVVTDGIVVSASCDIDGRHRGRSETEVALLVDGNNGVAENLVAAVDGRRCRVRIEWGNE